MSPWAALGSGVVELAGWWQQLVRLIGVAFRERRRGPRDRGELRVAVGVRVPFIGAEVGRGSSLKEALWYRRPFIRLAISGDRREIMGRGARWAAFSKKRGGGMAWHGMRDGGSAACGVGQETQRQLEVEENGREAIKWAFDGPKWPPRLDATAGEEKGK
jgi:hypothetical protein